MKVSFHVARMWQTAKISPETFWGPRVCPGLTYYSPYYPLVAFFLPLTSWAGTGWATSAILYGKCNKYIFNLFIYFYSFCFFSFSYKEKGIFFLYHSSFVPLWVLNRAQPSMYIVNLLILKKLTQQIHEQKIIKICITLIKIKNFSHYFSD